MPRISGLRIQVMLVGGRLLAAISVGERMKIGQHGAAHEGALRAAVLADHGEAERTTHRAAGAVDAEKISRSDAPALAGLHVLDFGNDVVVTLGKRIEPPAEMDVRAAWSLGAAPQRALEHHLRYVVGDFRRRPIGIWARQAAELVAAEARDIGGGALDVRRQALRAQRVGDAETAEMLHRARVGVVAFGMLR